MDPSLNMDWKWSFANFLHFTLPAEVGEEQAACVRGSFFWEQENVSDLDNWMSGLKFTYAIIFLNKKGFN